LYEGDLGQEVQVFSVVPMVEYKFPNGVYALWEPEFLFFTDGEDWTANHTFEL
jgi:hypothetical protein